MTIFDPPSPPPPPRVPATVLPPVASAETAAVSRRTRRKLARAGRARTILGGSVNPGGIVARPTLLGN